MKRWAVEVYATGPEGAVKISVLREGEEQPNATVMADYRAQASGLYRRQYQAWPKGNGQAVTELV